MIAGAWLDLDRDMAQPRYPDEPRFVARGRFRLVRNQRHDRGAMTGADAPNVEVAGIERPEAQSFEALTLIPWLCASSGSLRIARNAFPALLSSQKNSIAAMPAAAKPNTIR